MTNEEFSDMFSTLLNSYASRGTFGEGASRGEISLDEYEKSVLLTQAQDIIVKSYFDKTLNSQGQGFDDSARRQVDFSSLIEVKDLSAVSTSPTTVREYHSETMAWDVNGTKAADIVITNKESRPLQVKIITSEQIQGGSGVEGYRDDNKLEITIDMQTLNTYLSNVTSSTIAAAILDATCEDDNTGENYPIRNTINLTLENVVTSLLLSGDSLMQPDTVTIAGYTSRTVPSSYKAFDDRGIIYKMPSENNISKVLFILNEKLIATNGYGESQDYVVVPINYQEYDREMSKAYAQPLKKQAWRLFQNTETGFDIYSELIPRFDTGMEGAIYRVRYVRRPRPIILAGVGTEQSIEGKTGESSCELNPILHMDILQKAVELAIATRGDRVQSNNGN